MWEPLGINVEVAIFRGDAEALQAPAGDSVDVVLQSVSALIHMIAAEQPVIGFYAGFYQADFEWLAQPSIKTWNDVKGKVMGVSTYGSLSDGLTRYLLRKHGLVPEVDGGQRRPARDRNAGARHRAALAHKHVFIFIKTFASWAP